MPLQKVLNPYSEQELDKLRAYIQWPKCKNGRKRIRKRLALTVALNNPALSEWAQIIQKKFETLPFQTAEDSNL